MKFISDLANSEVAKSLIDKLTSPHAFIIVMSLIALFGGHWWSKDLDKISITISYWLWFIAMLTVTIFSFRSYLLDTIIASKKTEQQNNN